MFTTHSHPRTATPTKPSYYRCEKKGYLPPQPRVGGSGCFCRKVSVHEHIYDFHINNIDERILTQWNTQHRTFEFLKHWKSKISKCSVKFQNLQSIQLRNYPFDFKICNLCNRQIFPFLQLSNYPFSSQICNSFKWQTLSFNFKIFHSIFKPSMYLNINLLKI